MIATHINKFDLFYDFIHANIEHTTIFDEDYNKVCQIEGASCCFDEFVESIAFKYSYDFSKFIESMVLFLGIEDESIADYKSEQYLCSIH